MSQPVKCPDNSRFEDDLVGCGSTDVIGPDEEGFYDCLNCGLFFKPEQPDQESKQEQERTEK